MLDRLQLHRRWLAVAPLPGLAMWCWIATGRPGPISVVLPRSLTITTDHAVVIGVIAMTACCLVAAVSPAVGLIGLSITLMAVAVLWPIVQYNRYSGPVIAVFRPGNGVHENDVLAIVPATLAVIAGLEAWRLVRRT